MENKLNTNKKAVDIFDAWDELFKDMGMSKKQIDILKVATTIEASKKFKKIVEGKSTIESSFEDVFVDARKSEDSKPVVSDNTTIPKVENKSAVTKKEGTKTEPTKMPISKKKPTAPKKPEKILNRETFETSRELEYFSEKELRAQIGHDTNFWPVAILRELIDNSLDACEKSSTAPVIEIEITDDYMQVADNGPGIPIDIIKKSQDYLCRVSDKSYYVAPTRGQMGNALKVVYAAPFVLDPENPGYVEIGSHGELHHISITLDRILGKPVMKDTVSDFVRNGTFVKINSTCLLSLSNNDDSYKTAPAPQDLIEGYTAFNPHVTFILNDTRYEATDPTWTKWTTDLPTSAHWYNTETLSDLVAGYLAKERQNGQNKKSVREFVSEFRGLSGTAKQKKVTEDFYRADLSMFEKAGDIDRESLKNLLLKMQSECVAPKPQMLGIIGKDHITKWILSQGGAEPSITYNIRKGFDDGLPYVFEFGFAVKTDSTLRRTQLSGLNWSPCVGDVPDPTLRQAIQEASINPRDPVIFLVHIAKPRFEFMDRGKTKIEL